MDTKRTAMNAAAVAGAFGVAVAMLAGIPPAASAATIVGGDAQVHSEARKTLTGKVLGGRGMTLLALHSSGRATKVRLPASGAFKVTGAAGTTLHLVSRDGAYYGPILLRGNRSKLAKSRLVYSAVKGGGRVKLGAIRRRAGYAAVKKPVAPAHVNTAIKASALARAGKPVGAGSYGYVSVTNSRLLLAGPVRPALDNDRDGLPSAFDIDDNGNKILDNVDRAQRVGSLAARRRSAVGEYVANVQRADVTTDGFRMFSNYKSTSPDFSDIINVNVAVPTPAALDDSVRTKTMMAVQVISGATLSCTGQVYCPATPMALAAGPTGDFQWHVADTYPALKAGDIAAGDTFVETVGGANYPGVLNFAFLTTPALKSYTVLDSAGAAVATETVDWAAPNKAGSVTAPIPVDVTNGQKVKLTFWRPQRPALTGEAGASGYVDIGGLTYSADAHPGFCAATAAAALGRTTPDGPSTAVVDLAPDGTPSADRTLSMIVDLATCSANDIDIQAKSLFGDNAAQKVFFARS